MEKKIGASFYHRRSMKAETSRQIPHKLAASSDGFTHRPWPIAPRNPFL